MNNIRDSNGKFDYTDSGKIDALVTILQSRGKGFNSLTVDGEWTPVLSRQGKTSKKIQKFFDSRAKILKAFSNFDAKSMTFENINHILGKGELKAGLKVITLDVDGSHRIVVKDSSIIYHFVLSIIRSMFLCQRALQNQSMGKLYFAGLHVILFRHLGNFGSFQPSLYH
jgi:hypothetical protein